MQRQRMYHLLTLLQLSFGTLHKPGLRAGGIVIAGPRETPAKLRNLAGRFIDRDDIAGLDLLLDEALDDLVAQIVVRLHVRGFHRHLAHLLTRTRRRPIDLYLHHLALDDFRFLLDAQSDAFAECLRERFGFVHLQRVNLRAGHTGEWCFVAKGLCHANGDSRFTRARFTGQQNTATGYFSIPDHLHHDTGRTAGLLLAHHTLGNGPCLQHIVQP
uniref:Putative secreted protein n=1 Tax=Anopheles marajoara TaxID=58244 RepID=A0A2M4BZL4_9DIPT